MRTTIVCGVDRSHHARAAARLAGALAGRLGLGVELIHAVDADSPRTLAGGSAAVRAVTEEFLDLPGMAVRIEAGPAAEVLAEASRGAPLLVIGTRGEGALRQALLGSVSAKLTRDPLSPLVVVPPKAAEAESPLEGRTIVCGVRDGRDSAPAHAAASLASDLGLGLTLAHVLSSPAMAVSAAGGAPPVSMLRPPADEHEAATRTLEAIGRSIGTDIDVDVELDVLDGPPGPHLDRLAAARGAAMLAVGACDQSPLAGALAGTPPRHLMRHSARPVLICPRPRRLMSTKRRTAGQITGVAS
jgi:nucleotide-binding universal stress UspA family protein